jgi:hypothetical protein
LCFEADADNIPDNIAKMSMSALKAELSDRGLNCHGCSEKSDYVAKLRANWDAPRVKKAAPTAAPKPDLDKDSSIQDILAKMRDMGLNANVMNPADFKEGGKFYQPPADVKKPNKKAKVVQPDEVLEAQDEL